MTDDFPTRRTVLATSVFAAGFFALDPALAQGPLDPTPECRDAATLRQTEGPFFKPSSPERADLIEAGMAGQPIELAGFVLTRACKPLPGALVDLWHADAKGDYDNSGFRLRGHQFADADGRFRFRTIVPGSYPGRTRHFHVKVQPQGGRLLTTQLYFPGEAGNRADGLFRRELLIRTAKSEGSIAGRFDFVLDVR
jgi:protocatechuate 3,4-dioxygenase beta subunit